MTHPQPIRPTAAPKGPLARGSLFYATGQAPGAALCRFLLTDHDTNSFQSCRRPGAGGGRDGRACRISRPSHPPGGAVSAGAGDRYLRPRAGREAGHGAQAADRGGEPRRRGQQYRHGAGRARDAGRLHAGDRGLGRGGEPDAVQDHQLQPDQGFRAFSRSGFLPRLEITRSTLRVCRYGTRLALVTGTSSSFTPSCLAISAAVSMS